MGECKHKSVGYWPESNEEGWKCLDCNQKLGEPAGYSPQLDRSHTYDKVFGILDEMHNAHFVYCSNGTGADILTQDVVNQCERTGLYDQVSIMQYILVLGFGTHAQFWKEIGDGVVSGNDLRARCHCGQLATSFGRVNTCSEHISTEMFAA